jgi:DNA polymerase-3 subunit beta
MQLTCSQTELSSALSLVGRAISSRPTHPVLANVLLTADAATGRLSLTGFDLSLGIQMAIPAAVTHAGAITLPARLLSDIVGRLPEAVPLTLAADDTTVTITSLSGSYEINGIEASDYPDLPLTQDGEAIELDAAQLSEGLRATVFASSTDESKQLLTGVHLRLNDSGLECAATDGHRLAVLAVAGDGTSATSFDVTIPARSLRELERLLSSRHGAEPLQLFYGKGQVVFQRGDQLMTTRSLEGAYPNYRQLIPDSYKRNVVINRKALIGAMERVSVLADSATNVVKIDIDPDGDLITVKAEAQELGRCSETVAAVITGQPIMIAFNAKYVIEGLKAMNVEQVILQCNSATTPAVFEPVGDDGMLYLVMPVQVRA